MENKHWKTVELGELIDIKHGFAFKSKYFSETPSENILLTPGNFSIGGGFKAEKFKYYVGFVPVGYILNENDIIVNMTDLSKNSDTLGFPAIIPVIRPQKNFLHNQRLGKIIINYCTQIDKRYLFYLMCSQEYRNEILSSATGTTVKHTSPSRIKKFHFACPPIQEQQAIGRILGSLDDMIELNRQMNETLEAMARALFKSWFIDFDPVRAKAEGRDTGLPPHIADLFPDSFEESELGLIPKGWKVGSLGEIGENFHRSVNPKDVKSNMPYIGLEHMPKKSIALSNWGNAENVQSNKSYFFASEILFGKLRSYFHKVGVSAIEGVCSTDILVINSKSPDSFGFLLCHLSSDELIAYTDAASSGTKMPRTSWKDITRYKVVIPPLAVTSLFDTQIRTYVKLIQYNIIQSNNIKSIRDTLLPKLISGEIRVPEAGKNY